METSIRRRFALAMIALGIIAMLTIAFTAWRVDATRWVSHTRELLRVARLTQMLATDRETAIRGYQLGRDSTFLEPELRARAPLDAAVDSLIALSAGDPTQLGRARAVRDALSAWDRGFAAPTLAEDPAVHPASVARLAEGKRLFDAFRVAMAAMMERDEAQYRERSSAEQSRDWISLLATLVSLGILAIVLLRYRAEIMSQRRTVLDQQHTLEEQAVELEHQTVELEHQVEELHDQAAQLEVTVDELRMAEAELEAHSRLVEASESRLRLVLDSIQEAFFALDSDWRYTYVNPRFEALYERPSAQLVGQRIYDEFPTFANSEFEKKFREVRETKTPRYFTQQSMVNGRWLEVNANPSADGGVSVHLLDTTDRRTLEDQLRQAQKMEAVGQLAGGIAHDFNNLLTAITSFAQFAASELPSDSRARADIDQVMMASDRAASLTRQLLAFSRRQVLQPKLLDLNAVVSGVTPLLRRLIGEHIELMSRPEALPGSVLADENQLSQVLVNLSVNARDAMPNGGRLLIETGGVELDAEYAKSHAGSAPGLHAMISVSDSGIGMDALTVSRLFEPFFTTKAPGVGTGLGLSVVYGIVKQSGGSIYVYSEPGHGSTFKVYLPIHEAGPVPAPPLRQAPSLRSRTASILFVEDDPQVAAAARRTLEAEGHLLTVASNGEEALLAVKSLVEPPDLLVTDLVMPKLGGRELARRLRGEYGSLRVLFISGYTPEAANQHGVLEEGDEFLDKPFTPSGLARRVAEILGEN